MTTETDIVGQFGPEAGTPEILSALQHLIKLHALSTEDLYIKWEQFSYQKHDSNSNLSQSNLEQFKNFLQTQVEKKAARMPNMSNSSSSTKKPKMLKPIGSSPLFGLNVPKTPTLMKRKLNPSGLSSEKRSKLEFKATSAEKGKDSHLEVKLEKKNVPGFSTDHGQEKDLSTPRKHAEPGKILDSLNPGNLEVGGGISEDGKQNVKITPFYDAQKYKFRTMRQNLLDASDVLDEQIEAFTKIIQEHFQLSPSDFGDPTIQSQGEVYAVGRIVPDSSSSEDYVNMESLALETSRLSGIGRRVRLNLANVAEVSLFCGQIVGVRGKNATGDYLTVNEVLPLPYPNSPVSTSEELQEYRLAMEDNQLKVIVTSGPYLPDNSFDMNQLIQFVERINSEIKPHTLIMTGPFIDVTHPMVENGTIPIFPNLKTQPQTLDEVFIKIMAPILKNINPQTHIILIPSTRDAISKHAAYPQDSLDRKYLQLPKNFRCFTNPSTFQLNEVFFGCSNVDTFKDMKEITKGGSTSMRNRFDRVSEHILQQRRYYPVFPGGLKKRQLSSNGEKVFEHISGADLEVPYLCLTELVGNFTPDIIIIPSELQQFSRVVQNVVMINPGKFIKPTGGQGTYAQVTISSPSLEDGKLTKMPGSEPVYLHNVWKRARVDLVTS